MLLASLVQMFGPSLMEFVLAMVVAKEQTFVLTVVEQMSVLVVAEQRSEQLLGAGIE